MATQENVMELEVIQNDTKTWRLLITDNNSVAIDITDYLVFFTVKNKVTDLDTSALIQKTITCPSGTDSQGGIVYISLTTTDTNIALGNYTYDIKMQKNDNGSIAWRKTIVNGQFRVNLTVTKRTS